MMTSVEPTPDAGSGTTRIEDIEIVGLRLLGAFVLAWGVIDSVYVIVRLLTATYADDIPYVAWVLAEACIGWMLATRAPRIARWLRERTRVDSPA